MLSKSNMDFRTISVSWVTKGLMNCPEKDLRPFSWDRSPASRCQHQR